MRSFYRMPKTRTERFLNSFIPTSIQILNSDSMNVAELPQHYCNLSMTMITNKSNPYPYPNVASAAEKTMTWAEKNHMTLNA